jgi:hypothetical protein
MEFQANLREASFGTTRKAKNLLEAEGKYQMGVQLGDVGTHFFHANATLRHRGTWLMN